MQTDDHPPDSILVEWAPPDDKERWRLRGWDKHSRSIDCVLPCSHWLAWKSNFNLELRQLDARDSLRSSETHTSRPVDHDAPYIGPADIKQDILSHRLDANSAIVATPRTKTMEPVLYASVVAPPFLMLVAGVGLLVNQAVNPRTTVEEGVLYGTAFTAIGGAATLALGLYGLVWANWTNGVNIKTRPAVTVSEPPTSARATRMSTLVRFGPIIGELPAGSTFLIGPGFAAGRF